jgi:hypothetical protein
VVSRFLVEGNSHQRDRQRFVGLPSPMFEATRCVADALTVQAGQPAPFSFETLERRKRRPQ